jgi:hypothetical protein
MSGFLEFWVLGTATHHQTSSSLKHNAHSNQLGPIIRGLAAPEIPRGSIAQLSRTAKIPATTLRTWAKKLARERTWRPSSEPFELNHRAFTSEQEVKLVSRIRSQFLEPGTDSCDEELKLDAIAFHQERVAQHEALSHDDESEDFRKTPLFVCSPSFIKHFRTRHALSLTRARLRKRPRATNDDIQRFILRMEDLLNKFPSRRVINIDETNRRTVVPSALTSAEKGAESVSCHIEKDAKESVIIIAGISVAGTKLPLTITRRGKTGDVSGGI